MTSDHQHTDHTKAYKHGDHDGHHNHHAQMIEDFKKRFWISLILSLPILVLAPLIQSWLGYTWQFEGSNYMQFGLASLLFFYGGWPFLKGLVDELKEKTPGMMTLIALAISVAFLYSSAVVFGLSGKYFFWELASLIDIMLLGHWIEMKSVMGASRALEELAQMLPSTAIRISESGDQEEVALEDLQIDDIILIRPGDSIPADGIITKGESHVNESMLTGESKPVSKKEQDEVIGGSINDNGSLQVQVKNTGENSYLSKVISMVSRAQETKSKTQNLANRAAAWLFYVALLAGFSTLISWLALGKDFEYALERMVTVMIISCPHALGLAIPLVSAISTAASAQNGLLIRNRTAFENARKISVVLFDKTGTLTHGEFGLTRFESLTENLDKKEMLSLAASVESQSEHPIAAGVLRKTKEMGLKLDQVSNFENHKGKGISARINNQELKILSPAALAELNIQIPNQVKQSDEETLVFVLADDQLIGFIALADEMRDESYAAIRDLKDQGLKVMMATGDNQKLAKAVSEKLGLDQYYAEVLPEDKQSIVKELQAQNEVVAMTGDGVNDAPALAQANVGIAIGSGTDVAAETADILLVNSNPKDISKLIRFGKATYRKMMQNLVWATAYNLIALPLAAGVLISLGIILSPATGAVLMSLSTVIVAINAQLLKKQIQD
ncbi:copper-translocating P-type ATPase [Croceimicrobium hydrocarbonivorans]|uniref:Cadmium-translocating P-type ATPase n=1 Tax=Croceimicrobium hydrocarbonivorans TaxID=2761580 RepID=A0A7H0VES2_9FLAO|nr:copper-translocating P-type ATPase [Croceimicrobium hydrocarbonivorans]QNR24220.1 cadmium-translocating P-type ATPase [Croceimicrobium hydrocarbonivorans]